MERRSALKSEELALTAAELALDRKAEDVVLLDLRQLSPIADYFLVCSGTSDVHVRAICDAVSEGLQAHAERIKAWHVEGYDTRRWVLLDFVHVVVHVFQSETREYYSLERLWGDAPRRIIDDAPGGAQGAGT